MCSTTPKNDEITLARSSRSSLFRSFGIADLTCRILYVAEKTASYFNWEANGMCCPYQQESPVKQGLYSR